MSKRAWESLREKIWFQTPAPGKVDSLEDSNNARLDTRSTWPCPSLSNLRPLWKQLIPRFKWAVSISFCQTQNYSLHAGRNPTVEEVKRSRRSVIRVGKLSKYSKLLLNLSYQHAKKISFLMDDCVKCQWTPVPTTVLGPNLDRHILDRTNPRHDIS